MTRSKARRSLNHPAPPCPLLHRRRKWRQRAAVVRRPLAIILLGGLLAHAFHALESLTSFVSNDRAVVARRTGGPSPAMASPPLGAPDTSDNGSDSAAPPIDALEAMALEDPVAFLEMALDQFQRRVRDYTLTFSKREQINGRLSNLQVIEAMVRESPFSVRLEWADNAGPCSRVLYVTDRWTKHGQAMALIEPGPIARLFVAYVMRPIHGPDARRHTRRTVDKFGLGNCLRLTLKYCHVARQQGILDVRCRGTAQLDGSPTLVFERRLPYTDEDGFWPDRLLVLHVDKATLLPKLCIAYADLDRRTLLGRYQFSDVCLNVGLADAVFTAEGMGL